MMVIAFQSKTKHPDAPISPKTAYLPFKWLVLLSFGGITLLGLHPSTHAQTASFAPATRSNTTSNTMLDSVVGNLHSPIKSQTGDTGELYHIAADGTVTAPNGLIVNPGCSAKGNPLTDGSRSEMHSKYRFGFGRRGKGFETVYIGVSNEPVLVTSKDPPRKNADAAAKITKDDPFTPDSSPPGTVRRATLNASFGPNNVYVLPNPCTENPASDKTLTSDAASALAAADGNAFTLAGNRNEIEDVNTAIHYLNGDIKLDNVAANVNNDKAADETALPVLKAVVLQPYGTTAQQIAGQDISAEGFNLTQSSGIFKIIKQYIGKKLTFRQMHALTGAISTYYRSQGRAFITINVPPQTIYDGVLHINIMEYRLGLITVHGNDWVPAWVIKRDSGLETGQTLTLSSLKTSLEWINTNPFRTVDMIYRPGIEPGSTDVDLHVADRFPVYGYAAYNNQGDPSVGRINWYVGASWGNGFGLGHILTYQFNRTDSGLSNSHAGSWTIPISSRNAIQIFGSYAYSRPVTAAPWLSHGSSWQTSIRWQHMINHIGLGHNFGIDGTIQLGYDWKTTNSTQYNTLNTNNFQYSAADTNQFITIYNGSVQDPWGQTQINNQLVYGPGGFTRNDTRRSYESIIPYAKPNYVYDRLQLTRNISLPLHLSSTTKVAFQRASVNLLYSEQLMAGGLGNARGYFANTSFGSNANSFSEEIYGPSFSIAKTAHIPELEDTNKIGIFWDWVDNRQVRKASPTGPRAATLSSVGIDLNSSFNQRLNLTFDAGYRLRRIHTNLLAAKRGMFCDFQVIAGF